MKAKRILTAVLAAAMTIGTGTIAASANEWTKTSGNSRTYTTYDGFDHFNLDIGASTTFVYKHGYKDATTNWNIYCGSSNKYSEIGFSKPSVGTWAPGAKTLHTSAVSVSTDGKSYDDSDSSSIFCKTEISSKATVGWGKTLHHGLVNAEYDTLGFDLRGVINIVEPPKPVVKPVK